MFYVSAAIYLHGGIMFLYIYSPSSFPSRFEYVSFASQQYSTDFVNYYQKQIKWLHLHFGRNWNRNEQGSRIQEKIRIDVNRFRRDVKQVLTPSEWIHKFTAKTTRQMRSRTQFHVNLKISLTNFIQIIENFTAFFFKFIGLWCVIFQRFQAFSFLCTFVPVSEGNEKTIERTFAPVELSFLGSERSKNFRSYETVVSWERIFQELSLQMS